MRSRAELEADWSGEDIETYHGILDALEEAEARAMADAEREARRQR